MSIFPVMMVWCEGMLRFFSGAGSAMPQTQVVLSALGAGCFCSAAVFFVSALCGKAAGLLKRRGHEVNAERCSETGAAVCAGLISVVTALLFAAESVTRSVFTTYMSPGNLYSGAGNVLANYRGEFLRSLPSGVFRFFVFFLPILYFTPGKNTSKPPLQCVNRPLRGAFCLKHLLSRGYISHSGDIFYSRPIDVFMVSRYNDNIKMIQQTGRI